MCRSKIDLHRVPSGRLNHWQLTRSWGCEISRPVNLNYNKGKWGYLTFPFCFFSWLLIGSCNCTHFYDIQSMCLATCIGTSCWKELRTLFPSFLLLLQSKFPCKTTGILEDERTTGWWFGREELSLFFQLCSFSRYLKSPCGTVVSILG